MSTDLGDVYRLSYDHYVNGALATAGAATWTVTLPDGATSSFAATTTGTGLYRNDFTTTLAGRHTVRWVGTGANAGAWAGSFNVSPAASGDLISLADAKTQLNIPASSTVHDEELRDFIGGLTAVIEGPDGLGRVVVKRTIVESRTVDRAAYQLTLSSLPVISLTSVIDLDGNRTWAAADFHLDGDTGLLTTKDSATPVYGQIQFTYVAGYQVIPANITMAARVVLQDWWRTQRAGGGGPRFVAGSDENSALVRAGWGLSLLSPEARQLLGPPLAGLA